MGVVSCHIIAVTIFLGRAHMSWVVNIIAVCPTVVQVRINFLALLYGALTGASVLVAGVGMVGCWLFMYCVPGVLLG